MVLVLSMCLLTEAKWAWRQLSEKLRSFSEQKGGLETEGVFTYLKGYFEKYIKNDYNKYFKTFTLVDFF